MKRGLTWLRMLLVAAVAGIFFWTIIFMILEEQFIYFPQKYPKGVYDLARSVPHLKDCWIKTEDSVKIHGWFAGAENAKATLIIAHGNGGNISYGHILMRALQRRGYNVLMYDYRGYGRSEGSPTENGLYRDGRAAYDYALALPGVHPSRVILWGTSLGGAVALDVATQRPIAGLILESTFTSAKDVAKMLYPFLPVQFFLHTKFNSIDKIRTMTIPILIMHGSHDTILPLGLGRRLYQAANEPKEFYEIAGADHNDTFFVGGDEYYQRVDEFVAKATSLPASRGAK